MLGAVLNSHPTLFRAMVLRMPFLDPISAGINPSLALTTVEYSEWGRPATNTRDFDYMLSYSPYHQLDHANAHASTTSVFLRSSLKDERVPYWQALKWVAKRRTLYANTTMSDPPLTLLSMSFDDGHLGSNDMETYRDGIVQEQCFLLSQIMK